MLEIIKEYIWPKLKIILVFIVLGVFLYFYIGFRKDNWKQYNDKIQFQKDFKKQAIAQINNIDKDKNILGYDDAKITIIEYINVMCPYSLKFHRRNYNKILEDFVETHKAKYVIRVALASDQSKIMARIFNCINNNSVAYEFLNNCMLYYSQWIALKGDQQREALRKIANFSGVEDEEFYLCYNNTGLDGTLQSKEQNEMKYFMYLSTPMVIINQEVLTGDILYEKLKKTADKEYKKAN